MGTPNFRNSDDRVRATLEPARRTGWLPISNPHASARLWAPLILLVAFTFFVALYVLARPIYFVALHDWGVPVFRFPFLDMHAILSALECKRQGVDVMRENPCDVLSRPHVYSPLWLSAAFLPINQRWLVPVGTILDFIFICSLYQLPVDRAAAGLLIIACAAVSPATAYALERANNDLIIFVLVIILARAAASTWPKRGFAYAMVLLAALLKYYPASLLILLLRETPKRLLAVTVGLLVITGIFVVSYHHALAENIEVLKHFSTGYFTDSFDFRNLPFGSIELLQQSYSPSLLLRTAIPVAILAILFGDLGSRIWRFTRYESLFADVARLPVEQSLYLLMGATLIMGCFFAGKSVLYREIYFLLTLPALLTLCRTLHEPTLRAWVKQIVVLIVFLMWSEFFRNLIRVGAESLLPTKGAIAAEIVFWVCKELAWWRVIAVFCTLLVALVSELPTGRVVWQRFALFRVATKP